MLVQLETISQLAGNERDHPLWSPAAAGLTLRGPSSTAYTGDLLKVPFVMWVESKLTRFPILSSPTNPLSYTALGLELGFTQLKSRSSTKCDAACSYALSAFIITSVGA